VGRKSHPWPVFCLEVGYREEKFWQFGDLGGNLRNENHPSNPFRVLAEDHLWDVIDDPEEWEGRGNPMGKREDAEK
jgi:hypothetical protein